MDISTRKALKARAHHLKPVVMLGNKGLTENVLSEIDAALEHHELIKVRIPAERDTRAEVADAIAKSTNSELVQSIGQVSIFFRESEDR